MILTTKTEGTILSYDSSAIRITIQQNAEEIDSCLKELHDLSEKLNASKR